MSDRYYNDFTDGPFCRHYQEAGECNARCIVCRHYCCDHGLFGENECGVDDCDCNEFEEND